MPINQFLFDHQLAAMKADQSGSAEDRKDAIELLGARAKRLADWRTANGLSNMGWPRDKRASTQKDEQCDHFRE